jgi:hypothetical protein
MIRLYRRCKCDVGVTCTVHIYMMLHCIMMSGMYIMSRMNYEPQLGRQLEPAPPRIRAEVCGHLSRTKQSSLFKNCTFR